MVAFRRDFVAIVRRGSSLVSAIVFLSLVSCTAIYGKNVSTYLLKNSTKRLEMNSNPFRTNAPASRVRPQGGAGTFSGAIRAIARRQTEEEANGQCRSFVMDVVGRNEFEFYNPGYSPNQPYPSQVDCVKTITAPPGYLLRLDFRNEFHLEQSEDCRFDYLEIRDGAHGYSNLIGSYCGTKHPPPITSSDRYLWLRFASDENIQYSGFTAVYWYIPRPTNSDQHPEMDMCRIEVSGNEGFANRSDIDEERIRFSTTYGLPLDCMWIISVEQGWKAPIATFEQTALAPMSSRRKQRVRTYSTMLWMTPVPKDYFSRLSRKATRKIMLQFLKFRLEKPNDCDSNFVDVFSDRTDLPSRLKNFCGSIADSVISKSNVLHLRFFAETRSINSTFEALFTAFRDKPRDEACDEDEYDCEDATCISVDLRCNGRINCRFRWDEDECQPKLGAFAVILESEHIIIILIVFCLILSGMCFAFLFNCTKKLVRDHRIIQEHLRQSKEKDLNEMGRSERSTGAEVSMRKMSILNHTRSRSNSSSGGSFQEENVKLSPKQKRSPGSYVVPGDIIPIFDGRKSKEQRNESEIEKLELSVLPEMRDSECQTRESLFSRDAMELSDVGALLGHRMQEVPPFSTFGYTVGEEGRRQGGGRVGHPPPGKRYKAEAVIEMKKEEPGASDNRPFSIESTKSAPDVIVTH